ncbi:glycoside hydrolase family 5 protein [Ferruginibacter sp.]|uniref:glycoside hydrolase family 5 protein n=1 Tax=Ferruginibacter sp. TaxID=1940288 RepID=UPI0019B3F63C|nr:glycoside hydrolase family 5 protein [Ferruginibacter sp.]MBC7626894.1 glycoside hydrolase family 5 protein [Ferruginibacter sp.]
MKLLSITFIFLCTFYYSNAQPVKLHGQLKVVGTQLTDQNNLPVMLNGMSFGWSCFHPRFYTASTVRWLYKDWKCSVVRAALGVEPDKGYLKDSAVQKKLIKTVIDQAIIDGIYVIIDWHSHNIKLPEANEFFKEMATQYGKYPNIIYELFNEPDNETWPEIKKYSTELISTIRAIDSNNIILVGSPHWDQDVNLPAEDPITGYKNLMYTMHFYAGTHKQILRDRTDAAIAKGLPIFVSESAGMKATGDGPIDYAEWNKWIKWMEINKISWVTWSVSDKDETCSVLNKSASDFGGWKTDDLKESGIKTRELLRSKAAKK